MESSSSGTVLTEEGYQPVFFDPRPLKNLLPIDEMESLAPITDMKVGRLLSNLNTLNPLNVISQFGLIVSERRCCCYFPPMRLIWGWMHAPSPVRDAHAYLDS